MPFKILFKKSSYSVILGVRYYYRKTFYTRFSTAMLSLKLKFTLLRISLVIRKALVAYYENPSWLVSERVSVS